MEVGQAAADLRMIRETIERARHRLASGGGGHIMIIWGVAWIIGYTGTQFLAPQMTGILWAIVNVTAGIASAIVGRRYSDRARTSGGAQIWGLWVALFAYGIFWLWLLVPDSSNATGLFFGSLAMLGYVMMGLMLESRFLVALGLIITALGAAGYMMLPDHFSLWMAVTGGGGLIAGGIYALRCWR